MDRIDLTSDTVTKPTAGMRRAMAEAEVGEERINTDPTVNRLIERIKELLGVEDAFFVPTATMANQIALAVHSRGGDDLIGHRLSHPFNCETGAMAFMARMMTRPIDGERGMFTPDALETAIGSSNGRVALIENTTNLGGGAVWPIEQVRAVTAVACRHGLACHMDASRLFNSVIASGLAASEYAAPFDTVTLCFSKGLGAPVGAMLAGRRDAIQAGWRFKHMFGGALRQAGILAAGALYALDNNIARMAEDHANARRLARGIAEIAGIRLDPSLVETNIIVFDVDPSCMAGGEVLPRMAEAGVAFLAMPWIGPQTFRLVTHMDVTAEMIEEAIGRFRAVFGKQKSSM
jgi:threonine aldolase